MLDVWLGHAPSFAVNTIGVNIISGATSVAPFLWVEIRCCNLLGRGVELLSFDMGYLESYDTLLVCSRERAFAHAKHGA